MAGNGLNCIDLDGQKTVVNNKGKEVPIINGKLAGKQHPKTGVWFNKAGFPKFKHRGQIKLNPKDYSRTHGKHVDISSKQLYNQVKNNPGDYGFTDSEMKFLERGTAPPGYTWHHNESPGVMQLVDSTVHKATNHTGGMSIWGSGH